MEKPALSMVIENNKIESFSHQGKSCKALSIFLPFFVLASIFFGLFNTTVALAEYSTSARMTFSCSGAGLGNTRSWLSAEEAASEWGSIVVQTYPEFGNTWVNGSMCEADNGLPVGPSPPYNGISGFLTSAYGCDYTTSAGDVSHGSPSQQPDGSIQCLFQEKYYLDFTGAVPLVSNNDDCVGNPISSSTGKKIQFEAIPLLSPQSGSVFSYTYNSSSSGSGVLGAKWQHSFNRSISRSILDSGDVMQGSGVPSEPIDLPSVGIKMISGVSANWTGISNDYITADEACQSGWDEVKSNFDYPWINQSYATYLGNEKCVIKREDGSVWRTIRVSIELAGTSGIEPYYELPRIYLNRPDGSVIAFDGSFDFSIYGGGAFSGWKGTWTRVNDSGETIETILGGNGVLAGYTYINKQNEVETYDANGKLISIESISGGSKSFSYINDQLDQVTDDFGRTAQFAYDTEGRIESIAATGGAYLFTYDTNNNLEYIVYPDATPADDGDNPRRQYHYEDTLFPNMLTGITDENGDRYATWAYDALGRANLSKHADGVEQVNLAYNADGTTTVTDAFGESRIYHFKSINNVRRVSQIEGSACSSCGGSSQSKTYDTNGNLDLVTDFNGIITDYDYDLTRNLEISRIEAKGTPQERTVLTEWHPNYRLKTCSIEPKRTTILDYYADSMLQTRTEVDTSSATLFPDAASKFCATIKARADFASLNKRAWSYTYDANNLLATVDGPRTDVTDITTYVHNATNGNLESVTNAATQVTNITAHDASGRPLRIVDANGLVTQLTYDARGRTDLIIVGTDTVFETTDLDYDGVGQLIKATLADGSFLSYDYDAAHRLTDIRDQQGNHIHYVLDAMGNRTSVEVKDPGAVLKRTHSYIFNTLNQLSQSIGADKGLDTQKITYDLYDANGNLKQTTDAQGNITQYGYDALDRLNNVIDALNGTTSYTYDVMGNLQTVTDPRGNTTVYEYDGLGNLTRLTSPDTGITNYTAYDGAGNLNSQTDAKDQTTVYQYDALNRLTQITYADASTTVYAYDVGTNAKGRLSSITDPSGSTTYAYDLHGRIETKTQAIGTISLPIAYHYNAQGQLDQITYPSGKVIAYSYSNGQISQLKVDGVVVLNNISFDPFGPVTGWDMGTGTAPNSISRLYDLDGQLSSYTLAGATKQLSYANTGNITALLEVGNPANDQSFDYDGLYRLTDYTGLGDTHVYGYDANGNRTAQVINGTGYGYSLETNNNRLQSVAGPTAKTYGYDALGNTTSDGLYSYNYDARNRLVGLNTGIGYTLNGLGQRVAKTIPVVDPASLSGDANGDATVNALDYSLILDHILGIQAANNADCNEDGSVDVGDLVCVNIKSNGLSVNGKTHYVYDEQGQLIGEYDKDGNVIQETVYLGNLPVAVIKQGNVYYIHADHLNTPRAITDAANTVFWSWLSDPFGATAANDDVDGDGVVFAYNLRFPGQYFDEETNLHYNYFRDYDPGTGRYLESDPIGLEASLNTYAYVDSNPLYWIDPYGLKNRGGPLSPRMRPNSPARVGPTLRNDWKQPNNNWVPTPNSPIRPSPNHYKPEAFWQWWNNRPENNSRTDKTGPHDQEYDYWQNQIQQYWDEINNKCNTCPCEK